MSSSSSNEEEQEQELEEDEREGEESALADPKARALRKLLLVATSSTTNKEANNNYYQHRLHLAHNQQLDNFLARSESAGPRQVALQFGVQQMWPTFSLLAAGGSQSVAYFESQMSASAGPTAQPSGSEPGSGQNNATWPLLIQALFFKSATQELSAASAAGQADEPNQLAINWPNCLLALVLIALMLFTAIGNLFVIVAILIERNLRTIGNYLVLSLAFADLLVACLVMPLAGIQQILDRWTLGVLLCEIWTSTDVFCCTGE